MVGIAQKWNSRTFRSVTSDSANSSPLINPLLRELIKEIDFFGPLTVERYMKLALTHPVHGFYMKQDVFGSKGHFITAPEISQIFGEVFKSLICRISVLQINLRPY